MEIAMWVILGLAANAIGMFVAGFIGGLLAVIKGEEHIKSGVFLGFLTYWIAVPLVLLVVLL